MATAKELFTMLTQDAGLDEATAQAIMKAAENEKVAQRAANLVQRQEYDSIATRAAALEKEATGAKVYQDWYAKNYPAIQKLQADALIYQERFGSLEEPAKTPPAKGAAQYSEEDVQRIVTKTIQDNYAPRWSNLLVSTGTILEKHIRAGRKSNLDFKKLEEIAATKGGDLEAAYDEYDRPERELAAKESTEAEIKRRVDEEMAKRRTAEFFPAGADATPSSGSSGITRHSAEKKGYDRSAVINAAVTGEYSPKPN
jgi:hypothetical protein